MVVVLRTNTPKEKTEMLIEEIKSQYAGVACHCTKGLRSQLLAWSATLLMWTWTQFWLIKIL